jgi:hypothetical protein
MSRFIPSSSSLLVVLLAGTGAVAMAQSAEPAASATGGGRIAHREARQQAKIAKGAAGGQLTAQETQNLEKKEAKVDANQQKAMADGSVNPQERKHLRKEERRVNKDVNHKLKNNKTEGAPAN